MWGGGVGGWGVGGSGRRGGELAFAAMKTICCHMKSLSENDSNFRCAICSIVLRAAFIGKVPQDLFTGFTLKKSISLQCELLHIIY